ncbi:ABC transporter substrate-binding protein [Deinococcus metallilatus]|uniref:ABC transporter substrate-binding protein n=1 Tax=Deinococcus metallilatus TaxID=1211322 RepID=A0AAJ5F344_9DEIO|nr:ABC transporter substrate-binding protein [Deinococcus metallilatus]MBB5294202.1 peptide/nickel transport system substrate-binding protein [Deinococcus metallilatus]QBY08981.1 ABC transporter substrate-binding protein [Deinococcus metallilatus]RXJ10125.1 ABC transporter substrate-binding protein [Deinococcus metallilatus]TLK27938.1 ABC transporter substrate-binding protein [Deinococcus metallilatus]GMA16461.1 ABC transporter substrate-binding protein [Deinococcus metallilatus]
MLKKLLTAGLTLALISGSAGAATLVFGMGGEPVSLDSGTIIDSNSTLAQSQVYDYLVKFKKGTTDLAPGLALRWVPNKDASEWTFYLRPGVKFTDGTPFNADAVVFNVNRWWDPGAPGGAKAQSKTFTSWQITFGGFKGDPGDILKSVRAEGPDRVVFTLTRPFAPFPATMATTFFGIASPTAVKKGGAVYGTPAALPVGTGPFIMQSWKTGDRITLVPNKNYWGTKASYDQLILRFLKDPSARLNELKAGAIDFTSDLNPEQLGAVKADKNLVPVILPSFNVGLLSMNVANPYLKNPKVRQAISMAINKKAIVDAFWNGLADTDTSIVPPVLKWANNPAVPADYKFDPQAAKKLLADAGYPNGFSLDLWYMPVSRPYFPTPKPIAEAMAADLGAIGIKANLKTEDWAKYLTDARKSPGFDMYMIGWSGPYASPYSFYNTHYGPDGDADTNYSNPTLLQLMKAVAATDNRAAQAKLYGQMQQITYDANVRIPIVHSRPLAAARTYVKGWTPSATSLIPFQDITLEGKQ